MAEPIDFATAASQLRLGADTSEQALVESYIAAARAWVENYTSHILVRRQIVQAFDRFTAYLQLHHRPIVSVDSIGYTDTAGAEQSISTFVTTSSRYPLRIYPAYNDWWPSTRTNTLIEVAYTAGYAPGEEPEVLIQAMLVLVTGMYENRGSIPPETQRTAEALCDQYRAPGL